MTDETQSGVLLKGADGSHYFIPAADLSRYAVGDIPQDAGDEVARTAPRLDAFSIDSSSVDANTAQIIMPGG
jgi:hypothetical protein